MKNALIFVLVVVVAASVLALIFFQSASNIPVTPDQNISTTISQVQAISLDPITTSTTAQTSTATTSIAINIGKGKPAKAPTPPPKTPAPIKTTTITTAPPITQTITVPISNPPTNTPPSSPTSSSPPVVVTTTPVQTPPQQTQLAIQWGAYVGDETTDAATFEALVGNKMDMQAVFTGWGTENGPFPSWYGPTVRDQGKTLVVFWEPSDGSGSINEPNYSYASIVSGKWDSYMASFAADAKAYGGPVILIPFEEMNGNWDPWDGTVNGNTPAQFAAAWQHVHSFFAGAPNVKFGWDPNADSVPDTKTNALSAYYPGSAYVDYVGVDGFNFGNDGQGDTWQSFTDIFAPALTELQTYNKPIYIFSMASAQGPQKAAWITDALTVEMPKYHVTGWIWFNINKEENWLINSDTSALAAFKIAIP